MSAFEITLPTASFPSTFDKAYPDLGMSDGSLLLIDFSHPAGYDGGSVIPVNDTVIPNIAYEQAAAIIGSGTRDTLSSRFKQAGFVGTSSSKHKVEWTGKKGLHTIASQSPGIASGDHTRITIPDLIFNHIFNNVPGRDFYISIWRRTTRAQVIAALTQPFFAIGQSGSSILTVHDNNAGITNGGVTDKFTDNAVNGLTTHYSSWRANPWTGTKPGSPPAEGGLRWSWLVGSFGSYAGSNLTTAASQIVYRIYIEDLLVSGRTWAQANAVDYALYQAAFGVGGRFYNDTFTAPSTIP